jgi:hypothetical protein
VRAATPSDGPALAPTERFHSGAQAADAGGSVGVEFGFHVAHGDEPVRDGVEGDPGENAVVVGGWQGGDNGVGHPALEEAPPRIVGRVGLGQRHGGPADGVNAGFDVGLGAYPGEFDQHRDIDLPAVVERAAALTGADTREGRARGAAL